MKWLMGNILESRTMKFFQRLIRIIWMCVAALFTLVGEPAWADLGGAQADALLAKAQSGDSAAQQTLMTEAQQGNKYAQTGLGVLYAQGKGVPRNYAQAVQWFRKAAAQGYAAAQYDMGVAYERGQGVFQDYDQAVQWFRKAAQQEFAGAQYNLGLAYARGQGVPQDYAQAAQWYLKAAQQGNPGAQYDLGFAYEKGQGVQQDYGQAVQWYLKAAQQGNARAQNNLGTLYDRGLGVPRNMVVAYALFNLSATLDSSNRNRAAQNRAVRVKGMTAQDIEAGQALTRQISRPGNLRQALDQYLAQPAVQDKNPPVAPDHTEADLTVKQVDALLAKAQSGDPAAQQTLTAQARQGNNFAQNALGIFYSMGVPKNSAGQSVPRDSSQAVQWFGKAAAQGNAAAQYNLGGAYEHGNGIAQDYTQAAQWYRQAAQQGDAFAQNSLGDLYANGRGVPRSKVVAYALYSLSAALNTSSANHAASNRSALVESLTRQEIKAGQALFQAMNRPGNLLPALDQYLAQLAVNGEPPHAAGAGM